MRWFLCWQPLPRRSFWGCFRFGRRDHRPDDGTLYPGAWYGCVEYSKRQESGGRQFRSGGSVFYRPDSRGIDSGLFLFGQRRGSVGEYFLLRGHGGGRNGISSGGGPVYGGDGNGAAPHRSDFFPVSDFFPEAERAQPESRLSSVFFIPMWGWCFS